MRIKMIFRIKINIFNIMDDIINEIREIKESLKIIKKVIGLCPICNTLMYKPNQVTSIVPEPRCLTCNPYPSVTNNLPKNRINKLDEKYADDDIEYNINNLF